MSAEIIGGPSDVTPEGSDSVAYSYEVKRGLVVHDVLVLIRRAPSGAAAEAVATKGRSLLEAALSKGHIPTRISLEPSGAVWEEP